MTQLHDQPLLIYLLVYGAIGLAVLISYSTYRAFRNHKLKRERREQRRSERKKGARSLRK